jgi:hypothetical protein
MHDYIIWKHLRKIRGIGMQATNSSFQKIINKHTAFFKREYTQKYRHERKYFLNKETAYMLQQRISYVLSPDDNGPDGKYHISSLYFDDNYNTSFYEKQNGILKRDKFRLRFYNGSMDKIRLEIKHKHGERVCKESADITPPQYEMMCDGDYNFMAIKKNPVLKQFYVSHVLKHMRPVVMVDYDRQAYIYPAGRVRVTFDTDIRAKTHTGSYSFPVVPNENTILEIKYDAFIPSHIAGLLSGIPFTQLAISKFVMAKLTLQGV